MPWFYLFLAGMFEVGWIYSLKMIDGFTRLIPIFSYAFFGLGTAFFLSLALRNLPVGVTYTIWVGIGIAGSNIAGMLFFGEPYRLTRILCILLIICGVAGLKFSSVR